MLWGNMLPGRWGGLSYLQAEHAIEISSCPFLSHEAKVPPGRYGWEKEP